MAVDISIGNLPWIEALTFQLGTQHSVVGPAGGTERKASIHDCVFTKALDDTSQTLFQACSMGQSFASATVEFSKAVAGGVHTYLTIELKDVMITSYSSSSGGDRPLESVGLNFTSSEFTKS